MKVYLFAEISTLTDTLESDLIKQYMPLLQVYTSTGSTTKRVLTDECVQAIYEKTKEHLTDGNFYIGLAEMIDKYT